MLSRPGHIIIGDGALMKCDSAAQLLTDWLKDCTVKKKKKKHGSGLTAVCGFLRIYLSRHVFIAS